MPEKELNLDLTKVAGINEYAADYSKFGEDYVFSHITSESIFPQNEFRNLVRFNSLSMILCLSGEIKLGINTSAYTIRKDTVALLGPETIVRPVNPLDKADLYVLFFSPQFMRDINIDINAIDNRFIATRQQPVVQLTPEESQLMQDFMGIMHKNANLGKDGSTVAYSKNISRCVMAAIVYHLMRIGSKWIDKEFPREHRSLRTNYVKDFVSLVVRYHQRERSVAFYADKLYISAKYMSLIIREATGRTAAQWIDDYVIMAAKKLLRFSGKNIQQVAYELNFSNQSAFGKYFKRITGMSPTDFQRQE